MMVIFQRLVYQSATTVPEEPTAPQWGKAEHRQNIQPVTMCSYNVMKSGDFKITDV